MTDIATLGLEVRSDGVVVASNRLQQLTREGRNAETSTTKLSSATSALTGYLKAAAAAFGLYKLAEYAKESALLAARYQTLGVVMNTVGATAGYTNAQMAGFEKTLQKQGIAMVESRQVLTQMAQAHLDLAKSSELARVAQDAATIGGINSSEAFERMVSGIQKGETEILKTIGINVNFEQSYVKMAATLGKSRDALSETEKSTARMNAVLERGKDIAGVYEAAMGTAGKQLTSMKRYMDNLKVTAGSVFNDILIVGVQAFTGVLKDANTEAEKLQQQNKMAEVGKQIVMAMATAADGIRIVVLAIKTAGEAIAATAAKAYFASKVISSAVLKDFQGAKNSMESLLLVNADAAKAINALWADPTKFQDAAKAMYAQRDANKAAEDSAKKALEVKQMAAGATAKQIQAEDDLAMIIKKHRDEWSNIVVEQLESKGLYVAATEEQIRMNKLTDEYRTLLDASKKSQEAMNALKAQELLEQQQLFDAKQRELDLDIQKKNAQASAYQQLIEVKKALGQDTTSTEADQLTTAYAEKRLKIEYAINEAANKGNDIAESINSQLLNQLDALYAQKDINSQGVNQLRQILGLQQSITSEVSKQKDNNALIDEYNASIVQTRTRDEQYEYDKYTVSGIGHAELGHFYGIFYGMVEEAAKQRIREYEAETAAVQAAIDAKAAETAAAEAAAAAEEQRRRALQMQISAISNASSALRSLAGDAGSLAASLRSAAENLRQSRIDIAGGDTSVLSPEQQYTLARDAFNQTLAQANATGDVELFNRLPQLAQEFLAASQGYNASNSVFGSDYASVQAALLAAANNADAYATEAEIMQSLLTQQVELLDAIRTALEEGGDTASLLSQLNGINNTIAGHTGNTVAGLGSSGNLYGVLNLGLGATGTIGSRLGTTAASGSLAALMEGVRVQTASVGTYTNSTYGVINNSLLKGGSITGMKGQVSAVKDVYTYDPTSTVKIKEVNSQYSYFANGGIANKASIFGEAGPEAAVPLPDGRTIPVTLYGASDGYDKELMQEILAELKALTRVQVAGNNGIIAPLKGMEKRLAGVENKARLAANQ